MKQSGLRQLILASSGRLFFYKMVLWLVVLSASSLINLGVITPTNPVLATLISFITIFILPGFLLSHLIFNPAEISLAEQLPLAFVVGLGLLSLPASLSLALEVNLSVLAWVAVGLNLTLASLYLRQRQKDQMAQYRLPETLNPFLLAALFLVATGVIYLFWITASTWSFGDNWTYLLYIRHYLDRPLTNNIVTTGGLDGASVRGAFNSWWVLQAFMDRVAGVEPVDIYSFYFPPLLMVVSLSAFYSLARELCQSRNMALSATLLQILYCLSSIGSHEWIGRGFFDRIIEDKFLIWLIILPTTTLIMLKYLSSGRKKLLVLLTLSLAALGLTHPIGMAQAGISWAAFAGIHLLFNRQRILIIRFVFIFLPLLLCLLVPLAQRQLMISQAMEGAAFDYTGGMEIQLALSRTRLWIFSALENSYMAHPHLVAHPLTLLAILLAPLLIQYLRQNIAAQFLFSNTVVTLLLLYNPLTAPLLGRLITPWMLWRISWLLPVSLTISFFLTQIGRWIQQVLSESTPSTRKLCFQQLTAVLFIILAGLLLQDYIDDGLRVLQERKARMMTEPERELLTHLREQVAPGSIIVANSALNTYIPAFTSSVRILTFRFVGEPSTVAALDNLYHQRLITQSALDLLERWDTEYVIVERNQDLAFQLAGLPTHFARRYQNQVYALYEVLPASAADQVVVGNTYLLQGKWLNAINTFQRALSVDEYNPLAYFGLGQAFQAQNKVEEAENYYQKALALQPDFSPAYLALAELYVAKGDINGALKQYERLITQQPNYLAVYEALGDLYLAQGEEATAIVQYRQAMPDTLVTGEYHLALANLLARKGLVGPAIEEYQRVITLEALSHRTFRANFLNSSVNPRVARLSSAYVGLGNLYLFENKPDQAIRAYQQAVAVAPNNIEASTRLGNLYLANNLSQEAVTLYRAAARQNHNSAWPRLELGRIYLAQGHLH